MSLDTDFFGSNVFPCEGCGTWEGEITLDEVCGEEGPSFDFRNYDHKGQKTVELPFDLVKACLVDHNKLDFRWLCEGCRKKDPRKAVDPKSHP